MLFAKGGKVVLARGSFKIPGLPEGIPISPEYPMDKVLTKSFEVTGAMEALLEAAGEAEDNAAAIGKELCFVAKGIDSLVVRKVGDDGEECIAEADALEVCGRSELSRTSPKRQVDLGSNSEQATRLEAQAGS